MIEKAEFGNFPRLGAPKNNAANWLVNAVLRVRRRAGGGRRTPQLRLDAVRALALGNRLSDLGGLGAFRRPSLLDGHRGFFGHAPLGFISHRCSFFIRKQSLSPTIHQKKIKASRPLFGGRPLFGQTATPADV
ncbi:hypothetical protein [Mycolicibacterium neworleansense]|uniref:hypothetical protein n=1 Tax=Mycolicibacterium neworleansense TaxID=146018 RepID=UPI0013317FBB|nr:hypothetical protein [Mycolicibacterium neworleansense]MCV7365591.1 hypothetical protein [Mycolicibacterium neworleansense]